MTLFQIITSSLLIIFALKKMRELHRQPPVKILYGIRWILIALIATLVVSFPSISTVVGNFFGITRGVDFVIYISLIWLLYKTHSDETLIQSLTEKVEELSREIALRWKDRDGNRDE